MTSNSANEAPFEVIEVCHGLPSRPIYYRISVGSSVKYLTAAKTLIGPLDLRGDRLGFSTVPLGEWDVAHMVPRADGKFVVVSVEKQRFPDATTVWHPLTVDLIELGEDVDSREGNELQLMNHMPSRVFCGLERLGVGHVIALWNFWFDSRHFHGLFQESYIYSLIQEAHIAPTFLAHLTDNHERVIGYVLESVPAREANIGDLGLCKDVLHKLHNLGIAHGRLCRQAFLIREDIPTALLQSFFSSYRTADRAVFDKEMSSLEEVLQQPSKLNTAPPETSRELAIIWERDGHIHPFLFWQLRHEGRISVSEEEHRAMLIELDKNTP